MTDPVTRLPLHRRLWLMLLIHPFECALGFALVVLGIRGLLGQPSTSLSELPHLGLLLYLAVSTWGGLLTLAGLYLQTSIPTVDTGVGLERAAMILVAASYVGVGLMLVGVNGWGGFAQGLVSVVIGGACLIRAKAIRTTTLVILEQLRRTDP